MADSNLFRFDPKKISREINNYTKSDGKSVNFPHYSVKNSGYLTNSNFLISRAKKAARNFFLTSYFAVNVL